MIRILTILMLLFNSAFGTEWVIPKNFDGGWFHPDVSMVQPGDTIIVTGDYAYAYLSDLNGTAGAKITIRTKTSAVFGTDGAYALILEDCSHYIIDGRNDFGVSYSIKFGKLSGSYSAQTLTPFNSHHAEIRYVEVRRGEVAFFANPSTGANMDSNYYHHNYIHDLRGTSSSEAFYIGNTSITDTSSTHFTNLRIISNIIDNVGGDGIQISCAYPYQVDSNTVTNFGLQQLGTHSTGILLGGNVQGVARYNYVLGSDTTESGSGMQCLGFGTQTVEYNSFINTGQTALEQPDAVYISKRGGIGAELLKVNFNFNIVTGAVRYGVNNDGTGTTGGVWNCDTVTDAGVASYRTNGDVVTSVGCTPASCNCLKSGYKWLNAN